MSKRNANIKKRNWAIVLYPESAPTDWREILKQTGLPFAVSPLHQYDADPTGEVKKAHYHIILCYPGPTTYSNVLSLCDSLAQPIPQPLESVRGMYRYFTHKDNPDKFQYDESEIETYNSFNILDYVDMTRSELNAIKFRLTALIRENGFTEYKDFINFVMEQGTAEEFDVAAGHTLYFNAYIRSSRFGND
jgi:hypothetical protein